MNDAIVTPPQDALAVIDQPGVGRLLGGRLAGPALLWVVRSCRAGPRTRTRTSMRDDRPENLVGQTLGKKFLVRRRIGAGGMGAVFEVEHTLTKRVGALKLLHPEVADRANVVERFLREASAAGRIGNPHIVETLDAGELTSGDPYMFMELLSGLPISELVRRRTRLRWEETLEIGIQAAEGLQAAHAAGIVHRDVKPENLFLCSGDPPHIKLLDFGISKFDLGTDHRLTAEGAPLGTPYYMSPEQVAGKADVDGRSDVYSLGVVLYECVTGRVPFDAESLPALSLKIFEGSCAPPSSLLDGPLGGLDEVIERAMATAPSQRYQSMAELRAALLRLTPRAPGSLARTLENHGSPACDSRPNLDETADLASARGEGVASAQTDRPAGAEPERAAREPLVPTPSVSPSGLRSGPAWLAAGIGLALLGGGAARLLRANPPPLAVASTPPARSAAPDATRSVASNTAAAVTAADSSSGPRDVPVRKGSLRTVPPPAAVGSVPRSSKAARDGLSEQNPFDH
jgi:serine/threonine protein kinase